MFPKLPSEGPTGLGEVGAQLQALDVGCAFVRVEASAEEQIPYRMVLPMWRHPGSANLMVDKDERKAMLLRLFNEKDTEIINHVAEKARAEAAAAAVAESEAIEEGGDAGAAAKESVGQDGEEKEDDAGAEQAAEKAIAEEEEEEGAMNVDGEGDA